MSMPVQKPYSSKQAVGTPDDFLEALQKRFGKITVDLAAHKANHVVGRYFAPEQLTDTYMLNKTSHDDIVLPLMDAGADGRESSDAFYKAIEFCQDQNLDKIKISVKNHDIDHIGFDSLKQDWAEVLNGELGFLNPEYAHISLWAKKCLEESKLGAKIALLVPFSSANWALDFCYNENTLFLGLNPRLTFKGHKAPYPKDLALIYFDQEITPGFEFWRWKD